MAKSQRYPKWSIAAIAGGVCLTAIEVIGAVGYLVSQNQPNYLVAGGAVVTVVAAILPILAGRCWQAGRWLLAILLWMVMVPALSVILVAAVERTGGAKDAGDRDRQAHALKLRLAEAAVTEAKADADAAKAKAETECSRTKNPKVTPRGPACTVAEERADKAVKTLKSARDEVVKIGPTPSDPMASRLAAVLPVTEAAVSLYQPLVLPLAISATGLLLIACGAHSPKRRKAPRRRSRRKKRRQPPKPPTAKVVPFRRRA